MKIKILFFLLVFILIFSFLVSCGKSESPIDSSYEKAIPIEKIEIIGDGLKYSERWGHYIIITPDSEGKLKYQIEYKIYPEKAYKHKVLFTYDKENCVATVSEHGLVEFSAPGTVRIKVVAMDVEKIFDTITIIAKK